MQLLEHFASLTLHPKNAQELKGLIIKLGLEGRLTTNWRNENSNIISGIDLLNKINLENNKKKDKLNKRDLEEKIEVLKKASKKNIPIDWIWCSLHDLSNFWNGKAHENAIDENGNYFLVNSRFVSTNGKKAKKTNKALSPLYVNDIAIVMSDVPDGKALSRCFLVKKDNKYTLNQRIGGITLFENVLPEYIVLVLDRNDHYLNFNDGKKQSNLKRIQMISCPIPLPSLEEQKEIVRVVEILFKEVEQLEQLTVERIIIKNDYVTSALQQLTSQNSQKEWQSLKQNFKGFFTEKSTIKKLREAVLQLAVQGKLTADWRTKNTQVEHAIELLKRIQKEKAQLIKDKKLKKESPLPSITKEEIPYELPEGWVWCRLGDVSKQITDGEHQTPPRMSNGKKLLSAKNVRDGFIDYENCDYISEEDYQKSIKRCNPEIGDLLIVSVGGTIGRVSMVTENIPFALVRSVAMVKNQGLVPDYLRWVMNSPLLKGIIESQKRGGAQPCLYLGEIKNFTFPIAPLEEQNAIVKKVTALMSLCDAFDQEVEQSIIYSEQLMQSVLREVFESNN